MESTDIDINLKIALVLARQHGWPIDYIYKEKLQRFVMVVPVNILFQFDASVVETTQINQQDQSIISSSALEQNKQAEE